MKWKAIAVSLLAAALGVTAVSAQTCEAVAPPLEALNASCADLVRGNLCQNGQTASFDGMDAFSVDTFALGRIQATYPDVDADQFISLALIGQLQVQPVVEPSVAALPQRVPVTVTVKGTKANVRPRPGRVGAAIAKLDDTTALNATGISKDSNWIRVQLTDQPAQGAWIARSLLETTYDLKLLPVVTGDDPVPQYPQFTPMQAFAFTSGSPCAGVVLQSADNLTRMQANGVALEFHDATVFLQNSGSALDINVLEGFVQIQAQDTTTIAVSGSLVHVPLDAAGQPSAAPDAPMPYDQAALERLAGAYGQRPVSVRPPASDDAIQSALVTPISGIWKVTYPPPYEYKSVEGPQCEMFKVKGPDHLFDISVADDGSSFSAYNPDIAIGAGVRVRPGLYEMKDFSFQVLSPTQMTATYDTNLLASCTSIITITAQWVSSDK